MNKALALFALAFSSFALGYVVHGSVERTRDTLAQVAALTPEIAHSEAVYTYRLGFVTGSEWRVSHRNTVGIHAACDSCLRVDAHLFP